jgi:hypothetical protein
MDYLDKLKHLTQRPENGATFEAGSQITWDGRHGPNTGIIDTIHTDDTGASWGFVTLGQSWAVVNLKFAKRASL